MTGFFAQGDILIEQIRGRSRLARAEAHGRTKSAVIAEGEASGHCHRLVGEFVFYRDDGLARDIPDQLYLGHVRVGRSTAQLLHEEHATVVLNPGVYRVRRQRQLEPTDSGPFEDTEIVGD